MSGVARSGKAARAIGPRLTLNHRHRAVAALAKSTRRLESVKRQLSERQHKRSLQERDFSASHIGFRTVRD